MICGGAALTRKYVEDDLRREYSSAVFYADDAFGGLHIMEDLVSPDGKRDAAPARKERRSKSSPRPRWRLAEAASAHDRAQPRGV